ncbi:hypothetical protein [Muricoccus pecuniae]|uniref:Uncharacterized protein n=1 Tax=Muricoccus pecuniae TaxID=693023 RepID=A0A840YGU7_9PROT|nr:hypothetical protein [Roseomonas pecuniae]MBB5695541.1 hypothetical protein [Roseomonas pecuniae]
MSKNSNFDWNELDTDVVVERRGFRAEAWGWRITNNGHTVDGCERGYRCAEDAYAAAHTYLKHLRATSAPVKRSPKPEVRPEKQGLPEVPAKKRVHQRRIIPGWTRGPRSEKSEAVVEAPRSYPAWHPWAASQQAGTL